MTTLAKLEALIAAGAVGSIFVGRSVVPGRERFATLRVGGGETVGTGAGDTCEAALIDAMANLRAPRLDIESEPQLPPLPATRPVMPAATRPSMPGMPAVRKLPGM